MDVWCTERWDTLNGKGKVGVGLCGKDLVNQGLPCKEVHNPGDKVALQAVGGWVVDSELVLGKRTVGDAASTGTASQAERVLGGRVGEFNPSAITAETTISVEDACLEDG